MSQKNRTSVIPGVTKEEETKTLAEILEIADENLHRRKEAVQSLQEELKELQEVYDVEEKEGLAQWFNTDARFQQVRQELLRSERSRRKPYFGRIDFTDKEIKQKECYYIGKTVIAKDAAEPRVIDWRAPIASVYYEKALGDCKYAVEGEGIFEINLERKRTYEIENDELKDFYDTDVVANDELLTKYLARNKRNVLNEIIATIQQEQNEIIRKKPQHNMIVQGSAGSGKTTVAMHRISYILYNYELEFQPKDFYIIGSNKILLNYITGILPDLDVYGASQMTMEQLFIRLLYEDWDEKKYTVIGLNKNDRLAAVKGSFSWFHDLEDFCTRYEWNNIPREDVIIEKTQRRLMSRDVIESLLVRFHELSLPDKLDKLTEHLMSKLENEIYGKYHSYPVDEQKRLMHFYQTYFGKREWKGSIFNLYQEFLEEQNARGHAVQLPETEFDLYDMAALAYLYKRIKETEVICEASHVVIDEAQDFGMMVYGALKYCLSKCTYTIMGDVSQNIYFEYGLTDWEELRGLMLPGEFDYFGVLQKSYRNTVEISQFATDILHHGSFPIYPVEPIIRHGNAVRKTACMDEGQLLFETVETLQKWQNSGYETIAVICRDEKEAAEISKKLQEKTKVLAFNPESKEFGNGVMVLPIEYAKGLEFDAVLLFNANKQNYPAEDGVVKQLYVAATRALHELTVLYLGTLTDLIATPVSEEKRADKVALPSKPTARSMPKEEQKTKKEVRIQRAIEGRREMELREQFGPKRIAIKRPQVSATASESVSGSGTHIRRKIGGQFDYNSMVLGIPTRKTSTQNKQPQQSEFGDAPDNNSLRPIGHPNLNMAVKWINSSKDGIELTSFCGILRVIPISDSTVRIGFAKTAFGPLAPVPEELIQEKSVSWKWRETRELVELTTNMLLVRIMKNTGVISFYTANERLLLSENAKLPRQIGMAPKYQTWTYFDWGKREGMKACGIDGEWLSLTSSAKYISLGEKTKRPACIVSDNGYQILVPAGKRVLCCTIPMYGQYLCVEGVTQTDYFFRTVI